MATRAGARHPVKDAVLTLAGAAGVLSLLWFVIAATTGMSIMIVTTGSMAPTIPAGSAALVRPVAASEIAPGDVVTVQRPGARLPVTHRVVSVSPDPEVAAGRILVLRGDANESDDLFPYHVSGAKLVLGSLPGVGSLLVAARHPLLLGLTTLGVAALVVWAFWPGRRAAHRREIGATA